MKKIIPFFLSVTVLLFLFPINSFALTSGDWEYDIYDNEWAIVEGYTGSETEIVLPVTLDGYTVTNVGRNSFSVKTDITSITIPDGILSIEDGAFANCTNLSQVLISDELENIDDYAFSYCTSLQNIKLPDKLEWLGSGAFNLCKQLSEISIPENVTLIHPYTFSCCSNLTSVELCKNIKTVYHDAFDNCNSLTDVYYRGSEEDWNKINFGSGNSCLTNATIHYNYYPPHECNYISAVTLPTCTKAGFTTYTCSLCGASYTSDKKAALGHKWNKGKTKKQPTFKVSGEKLYTCTACGKTKTVQLSKLTSPSVSKLKASKKSFSATWKKAPTVAGYEIWYSTNPKFKKATVITIKSDSKTVVTVKNLKAKKKYYVRIRAYKKINGNLVYSPWSKAKTVTTKK